MDMKHLDLFSGIGGFALACRMVGGIETVGFCERDKYCQRVLAKHWPGVPICNDIHEMKGNDYGPIDLITGGFPCQPFSCAGKRKGEDDDRHLWPAMVEVIAKARPRWVLAENVAGHVTMGLDEVLSDLDSIGYAAEATVVPACAVDARHRRDRVWIMAYRTKLRGDGGERGQHQAAREIQRETGGSGCSLADSASEQTPWQGSSGLLTEPSQCCRWEPEPAVGRVVDGLPGRLDRLRGLGNAIVPQVAAEIIAAMKRVDNLANAGHHLQPESEAKGC
jgi:DNA (cytosine-5)-methyltransferase 1